MERTTEFDGLLKTCGEGQGERERRGERKKETERDASVVKVGSKVHVETLGTVFVVN